MECLEQVLRFHSKTQKCWLSQLHSSEGLSVFDILVYFILFRVSAKPRPVMNSIRHHVREGILAVSNIQVGILLTLVVAVNSQYMRGDCVPQCGDIHII